MNTLAGQGVQVHGKRRGERLALAGAHLGNLAVMKHHAADQLDIEMAHAERTLGGLAAHRKRFGEQLVEGFPGRMALTQLTRSGRQGLVGQLRDRRLERVDRDDGLAVLFQQALISAAEHLGQEILEHGLCASSGPSGRIRDV